jgi:hypothetical protein
MEYFCTAIYHAERRELDYAVFFAEMSAHPNAGELIRLCKAQQAACRDLNIKACEYGRKRWYRHAAKQFAAALQINTQDETAKRGLIYTAGKGFIL